MSKLKRYAVQKTYIKNGVKIQQLKNLSTGSMIYRKKSEVDLWYKRPDFEILLEATPANVKTTLKHINARLASYRQLNTDDTTAKIYVDYLSQVQATFGADNITKSGNISLSAKAVKDIIDRITTGGYRFDVDRLQKSPTVTQLLDKDKIPTQQNNITLSKDDRISILKRYEDYKLKREEKWSDFFTWWYSLGDDVEGQKLKSAWYHLYEMLTTNAGRKNQYEVYTVYDDWATTVYSKSRGVKK